MTRPVVLYHRDMDGFAAACAVAAYLDDSGMAYRLEDALFLSVQYDEPIPEEVTTGKEMALFIVDFSYELKQMRDLIDRSEFFLWVDHHESSVPVYEELRQDDPPGWFRVTHKEGIAGAVLTWQALFDDEVPELLSYVEDRDLWTWKLKSSKEVSAALALLWEPWFHEPHLRYAEFLNQKPSELYALGGCLLQQIENRVKTCRSIYEPVKLDGHPAAAVNTTVDQSEVGHGLLEEEGIEVAVMYFRVKDKWVHSLRSKKDGVNVAKIAEKYGGGGHAAAAGFSTVLPIIEWEES